MSAAKETKTTTMFDGNQSGYVKYRIQLRGEFTTKGAEAALGPKFGDLLPTSKNASVQIAKQKEAVNSNISGIGLLVKTNKSEDLLVMIDSTV